MDLESIWEYAKEKFNSLVEYAEEYAEKIERDEYIRARRMSDGDLIDTNARLQCYNGDDPRMKIRSEKVAEELQRRGL